MIVNYIMRKLKIDLFNYFKNIFWKNPEKYSNQSRPDKNLSILVGSCDKYEPIWNNFLILFDRYWDDRLDINKYFISETIPVPSKKFQTIFTGYKPFSECLRFALDNIESKYILWLQDDYYLRKVIPKSRFDFYLYLMNELDIDRLGIHVGSNAYISYQVAPLIYKFHQHSLYTVSMQASIWKKESLIQCLPDINFPESPWEFEINGSERMNRLKRHSVLLDRQVKPWYVDITRRGKFCEEYLDIIKEENLVPNDFNNT